MTTEEKAKRYDEALEMARDSFTYPDYPGFIRADVVFPELKESEDEKMRKRLIAMCQWYIESYALDPYNLDGYKEALAWLEKQRKKGGEE